MRKLGLALGVALFAPITASAATFVTPGDGPYDITQDSFFFGVVLTDGGPGSFAIDFFSPLGAQFATNASSEASLTLNVATGVFNGLTMGWTGPFGESVAIDGAGVFQADTIFNFQQPEQQLLFTWSDSLAGGGFDFDILTEPGFPFETVIPVPAALPLLVSALVGVGFFARRRRAAA